MEENKTRIRLGVIFGGRSGEHSVSLMSARSVLAALDLGKYEVTQIGISRQGAWYTGENLLPALEEENFSQLHQVALLPDPSRSGLHQIKPFGKNELLNLFTSLDVVIPVLHGTFGEDGAIQGLFEMADLAYVGAGVLGSALAMDKGVFKDVMRANDVPVLEYVIVLRSQLTIGLDEVIAQAEQVAPYPLFTKPANLGSSVGITKCRTRSDLIEGLMEAAQYDRRILIERGLEGGREIEVSILGNTEPAASIPGEIIPSGDFYSYQSKYYDDRSQLLIPAPLPDPLSYEVRQIAIKAYLAIDCAGMARVDFLLDNDTGELFLNEINTIPGFTRISMYPKLWEASGLTYSALLDRLVGLALDRKRERDETVREFRSVN